MVLKTCNNCEYCLDRYHECSCTRYPKWIGIYNPDFHWCGEWKEKESQEEQDD